MKIEAKEEQSNKNPSRIFWQFCDTGKMLDFHHVRVRIGICLFLWLLKRTLRAFQRAKDRPNRSPFTPPIEATKMTPRPEKLHLASPNRPAGWPQPGPVRNISRTAWGRRLTGRPVSLDLGRLGRRERDQVRLSYGFQPQIHPKTFQDDSYSVSNS